MHHCSNTISPRTSESRHFSMFVDWRFLGRIVLRLLRRSPSTHTGRIQLSVCAILWRTIGKFICLFIVIILTSSEQGRKFTQPIWMIFCKQFCQSQPTPTHTHTQSVRPKDQMLLGQAFCAVGSPEITIHNQRAADKLMKFMGTCVAKYLCTKTFFDNSSRSWV